MHTVVNIEMLTLLEIAVATVIILINTILGYIVWKYLQKFLSGDYNDFPKHKPNQKHFKYGERA